MADTAGLSQSGGTELTPPGRSHGDRHDLPRYNVRG